MIQTHHITTRMELHSSRNEKYLLQRQAEESNIILRPVTLSRGEHTQRRRNVSELNPTVTGNTRKREKEKVIYIYCNESSFKCHGTFIPIPSLLSSFDPSSCWTRKEKLTGIEVYIAFEGISSSFLVPHVTRAFKTLAFCSVIQVTRNDRSCNNSSLHLSFPSFIHLVPIPISMPVFYSLPFHICAPFQDL